MADEKKSSSSGINPIFITPLIILGVLLLLTAFLSGQTVFNFGSSQDTVETSATQKGIFNIYRWIGSDQINPGQVIINTTNTIVRNSPAGLIIGEQNKLKTGLVRAGPVDAYGAYWVRIDYQQAPSGWVNIEDVTTRVGIVRAFNIIPITYNFIKPIGYGLLVLFVLLAIYLKFLIMREERITLKKIELKEELANQNIKPIEQIIEEKPDVQEVPGFKTEEIVPVEILEQQNRWKHIQDLIASYNQNDWRQAIIEADIILEEMLDRMGYKGVTIGDKLKTVERSDFITLDKAWSAHKIRNQIAHDGSGFKLTRELAEKTIKEYEEVFREFYYI